MDSVLAGFNIHMRQGPLETIVARLLDMVVVGNQWESFYIFAYCGLVVEIQPLNCYYYYYYYFICLLPFQRQ